MAKAPAWKRTITKLRADVERLRRSVGPRAFTPPMSAEEVEAFERRLGVALEDSHRAFLTEVTAGEEDRGVEMLLPPEHGRSLLPTASRPSGDFPFDDAVAAELLAESAQSKRGAPAPTRDGAMDGALPLVDYGDGAYDCVVLTGPQRGKIWHYGDRGWSVRYALVKKKPEPLDFLGLVARHVKDALKELPTIDASAETIELTALNLRGVPAEIFEATRLTRLVLSGNDIPKLPEPLFALASLRHLAVAGTGLSELSPSIGSLRELRWLSLQSNALEVLPEEIGALAELEYLNVAQNHLVKLPASLGRLEKLATLELAKNQLHELPPEIERLRSLQKLTLATNPLRRLPEGLAAVPVKELVLEEMVELDFAQAFEILANMGSLESLAIRPPCGELPPKLRELRGLRTLRLVRLGLTAVPEAVLGLEQLDTLSLDQNALTTLPEALGSMPSLRTVVMFANPIATAEVERLRAKWPHLKIEHFG